MTHTITAPTSLCGVPVYVNTAGATHPIQSPLLYEWRIYEGDALACVYIGKAKNGASRPMKTYPTVVRDLRRSRGVSKLLHVPVTPYFKRNPWGFRWIHHQLESSVERILTGNPKNERIELHFPLSSIPISRLHSEEALAISNAQVRYAGTNIHCEWAAVYARSIHSRAASTRSRLGIAASAV